MPSFNKVNKYVRTALAMEATGRRLYSAGSRYFKGSSKRKRRSSTLVSKRSPVPQSLIVNLRYVDFVNIDASTATLAGINYRANDIFKPDDANVGQDPHQPLGHDNWYQFYDHATVLSSRINVKCIPTGSNQGHWHAIRLSASSNKQSIRTTLLEQGDVVSVATQGDNASRPAVLNKSFNTKGFFKRGINDDSLRGSNGSAPSELAYFQLYTGGTNAAQDPATVDYIVTIDYKVKFTEPKAIAQS